MDFDLRDSNRYVHILFLRQTQKFKMYISTERDWRFEKNVAIHEILLECSFVVFVAFWKKLKCV